MTSRTPITVTVYCIQLGWSRTVKVYPEYFHFMHLALLLVITFKIYWSVYSPCFLTEKMLTVEKEHLMLQII